jgi:hypothetical protein
MANDNALGEAAALVRQAQEALAQLSDELIAMQDELAARYAQIIDASKSSTNELLNLLASCATR